MEKGALLRIMEAWEENKFGLDDTGDSDSDDDDSMGFAGLAEAAREILSRSRAGSEKMLCDFAGILETAASVAGLAGRTSGFFKAGATFFVWMLFFPWVFATRSTAALIEGGAVIFGC